MQRHLRTRLLFGIAALAGVCTLAGVSAMPAPPARVVLNGPPAQTAPTAVAPGTYSGKVTSNTNAGLTIHGNDGDRTVIVQPGAAISRDGKNAVVSDIKTGDDVAMTVATNGMVQSITATSQKSSGFNPLWLLLLLLLIPLVLLLLSRRKKNDFVVERTTSTQRVTSAPQATGDNFTVERNREPNQRPRA